MFEQDRPVQINMSGIPVAGVGGLGLVAMAILVSVVMPAAWWTMVLGVCGGCALAVGLVVWRRTHKAKGPNGDDPSILFRADKTQRDGAQPAAERRPPVIELGYSTR